MKRPLCLAAGGFVLGEAAALTGAAVWIWIPAVLASGIFLMYRRGSKSISAMCLLLLFVFLGWGRMAYEQEYCASSLTARTVAEYETAAKEGRLPARAEGKLEKISWKEDGCTLTLAENQVEFLGRKGGIRRLAAYLKAAEAEELRNSGLRIGMEVEVWGSLESFSQARNPGEFDFRLYYRSLRVDCRMFADSARITGRSYAPGPDFLYRLREHGEKVLKKLAAPKEAGIFCAAVLGDKDALDGQVKNLYQKNGIAHLLAVSGLHMSIVGLGAYRLLRRIGAGYGASGAAGAILVIGYGILTGASASAVRAALMLLACFLAEYLGRTYDMLSAAAMAALLLCWQSPYMLTQGGFQLSFAAVAAIGGASRCMEAFIGPGRKWEKAVLTGAAVQLLTLPIVLYHFFQFPLYGIVLNLAVIPLMGLAVYSGIGGVVLGSVSLAAGAAALGLGHYILKFYNFLCGAAEILPGGNLILGRPGPTQILLYYAVLAGALWRWKTLGGRKEKDAEDRDCQGDGAGSAKEKDTRGGTGGQSGGDGALKRGILRRGYAAALSVCCFLLMLPLPVSGLEIAFLDVGQGDGIVLHTGKKAVLVDGGSSSEKDLGRYKLEPFLKSRGLSRISCAVVSHGDSDHISGLEYLLENCPDIRVDLLLLPYLGREEESIRRLEKLAKNRRIPVHFAVAGDRISVDNLRLCCVYPGETDTAGDPNEQSLVMKAEYGEFAALLTGDMDRSGEEKILENPEEYGIYPGEIQVLKTAHHGSRTSTSEAFLDALCPGDAVISYGKGNRYGHPHGEVLQRFRERQIRIWETADSGAVILRTDGRRFRLRGWLSQKR